MNRAELYKMPMGRKLIRERFAHEAEAEGRTP
jgi:hypothetical protein